jgi:two-component system NtrC family sensor kinase
MTPGASSGSTAELPPGEGASGQPASAAAHTETDPLLLLEARLQTVTAERDQIHSELTLRNCALDSAQAHFMILDALSRPWKIVFVNQALAQSHGYEPADLIGMSPAQLIDVAECEQQFSELNEAMRKGEPARTQLRSRRRDGTSFWAGLAVSPVRDASGRLTHYVSVGSDITKKLLDERNRRDLQFRLYAEMKERERMAVELRIAQKLEAVGQLAAGIAHEINTPVQYVGDSVLFLKSAMADFETVLNAYRVAVESIPGAAEMVAAKSHISEVEAGADLQFLSTEVPKAFERTLDGVERVANIVRAMKEFAHPDTNEQSTADINRAIDTTLTVARNEYKYCAQVETRFGALPDVMCNIGELNQVFLNLIVNAAHAIQESGKDPVSGQIVITTEADTDTVRIHIADNGCGIPEKIRERIFDPFFTTKEVGKGTGQGLAITRSIVVEKHGGRIDVKSQPGEGTQFTIAIPIAGRAATAAPT